MLFIYKVPNKIIHLIKTNEFFKGIKAAFEIIFLWFKLLRNLFYTGPNYKYNSKIVL